MAIVEVVLKARDNITGVINNTDLKFNKLAVSAKALQTSLVAVGGVAVAGVLIRGMQQMAAQSIAFADQIDKTSKMIQMSTGSTQRWDYVAKQTGTSIEALSNGIQKLQVSAYEAHNGSKSASEGFKALGMSIHDQNKNIKNSEQLFREAVKELADVKNGSERAAIAQKLFGKSGQELLPILAEGSDGIQKMLDNTSKYNLILSEQSVKRLDELGDSVATVQQSMKVASAEITANFAPALTAMAEAAAKASGWLGKLFTPKSQVDKDIENLGGKIKYLRDLIDGAESKGQTTLWKRNGQDINSARAELDGMIRSYNRLKVAKASIARDQSAKYATGTSSTPTGDGSSKADSVPQYEKNFLKENRDAQVRDAQVRWERQQAAIQMEKDAANEAAETQKQWNAEDIAREEQLVRDKMTIKEMELSLESEYYTREYSLLLLRQEMELKAWEKGEMSITNIQKIHAEQRKKLQYETGQTVLKGVVENLRTVAGHWKKFAVVYKTMAIAQAVMDTYSGAVTAFKQGMIAGGPYAGPAVGAAYAATTIAAGVANIAQIAAAKFAMGGSFVTNGPQMIMVGDNPGGRERVSVTPESSANINGPANNNSMTIQIIDRSGNIVDELYRDLRNGAGDKFFSYLNSRLSIA